MLTVRLSGHRSKLEPRSSSFAAKAVCDMSQDKAQVQDQGQLGRPVLRLDEWAVQALHGLPV